MAKRRKIKLVFLSIFSFLLGSIMGFVGNIFLALPASYEIEKAIISKQKTVSSASVGADVIKSSNLSIHFLEVGNRYTGDCIYIKVGDTDILVDAGSKESSIPYIEKYVDTYCEDGKLDYVIVTHAHEDHYAGFATGEKTESIFDYYTDKSKGKSIDTIIGFAQTNKTESNKMYANYKRELNQATSNGAKFITALDCWKENPVYELTPSESIYKTTMHILYTDFYEEEYKSNNKTENNFSVCFVIIQETENGTNKYLFTGDLEEVGEKSLIANNDKDLISNVTLYKAGHHGSKTSSSKDLMEIAKPETVVVCCCAGSSEYTTTIVNQFPTQAFIDNVAPYTDQIFVTTMCVDYKKNEYIPFNGNIVIYSTDKINISCSNNNKILKDTDWFKDKKNGRTWPNNGV